MKRKELENIISEEITRGRYDHALNATYLFERMDELGILHVEEKSQVAEEVKAQYAVLENAFVEPQANKNVNQILEERSFEHLAKQEDKVKNEKAFVFESAKLNKEIEKLLKKISQLEESNSRLSYQVNVVQADENLVKKVQVLELEINRLKGLNEKLIATKPEDMFNNRVTKNKKQEQKSEK